MTSPTHTQLLAVPATVEGEVLAEYIDENGHMNIARYFELGGLGTYRFVQRDLGMPLEYLTERGLSTFTVEHHLRYLAEMREGDRLSVHPRLVDATDKAAHLAALVVDRTHERLACVVETVIVHVDLETRRSTPFPEDVAAAIAVAQEADRALGWPAPLSGGVGLRR